jgi:SAM-dependent methyltransferase
MTCRICGAGTDEVLDLGRSPPANSLLSTPEQSLRAFPLVLERCRTCGNVQLRDCLSAADLYSHYFYVTPDSPGLREHYASLHSQLVTGGYLEADSVVLEVGSNAGLLLEYLRPLVGAVLGIDPAANICELARQRGIDTVCDFFNPESAAGIRASYGTPQVILARHCMAHNCDPNVMVAAAAALLDESGHLVVENAYALNTVENNEFDQVYHEHMFYFTIQSMQALLGAHGMHLVDVFMAPVHGGSIVFVAKKRRAQDRVSANVARHLRRENQVLNEAAFERFARNTERIRTELRALVADLNARGQRVFSYGATAKGNTLLNYVGLTRAEIPRCVDSTPIKQGKFLPGSAIEVISEQQGLADPPDYFLLTAWNYRDEIIAKVRRSGNQHTQFIVPIPRVHVV